MTYHNKFWRRPNKKPVINWITHILVFQTLYSHVLFCFVLVNFNTIDSHANVTMSAFRNKNCAINDAHSGWVLIFKERVKFGRDKLERDGGERGHDGALDQDSKTMKTLFWRFKRIRSIKTVGTQVHHQIRVKVTNLVRIYFIRNFTWCGSR